MDAVTLTFEELLALSPKLHSHYKELLMLKHQPVAQVTFNNGTHEEIISPGALENVVWTTPVFVTNEGLAIPDMHEVFAQVDSGQHPVLQAVKEANSLQSIHMLI